MNEAGVVHSVKGNEILVKLKRHSACLGCRACLIDDSGDMFIKAITLEKVKVGDRVVIEIDSISLLKAILLVYLLPAAAFLVGVLAGFRVATLIGVYRNKELFSMLGGIILLAASLFFVRAYGRKNRSTFQTKIEKIGEDRDIYTTDIRS